MGADGARCVGARCVEARCVEARCVGESSEGFVMPLGLDEVSVL